TFGVVAVFDFYRVINEDEVGTNAGDAALDRHRVHPATICGEEVHYPTAIFGKPGVERLLEPLALQNRPNGVCDFIGELLTVAGHKNLDGRIVRQNPSR